MKKTPSKLRFALLVVPLLFATPAAAGLETTGATAGVRSSDVVRVLPDSIRLRMLAALLRGDVEAAIAMYQVHTGTTEAPRWLLTFQAAFNVANRVAGPCQQVAKDIYDGFQRLGGSPTYIRFMTVGSTRGSNLIGFEVRAGDPGSARMITAQFMHVVVKVQDRVYDAWTGAEGLPWSDYLARLSVSPGAQLTWAVVNSPWAK